MKGGLSLERDGLEVERGCDGVREIEGTSEGCTLWVQM